MNPSQKAKSKAQRERMDCSALGALIRNTDLCIEARERAKRTGTKPEDVMAEIAYAFADAMQRQEAKPEPEWRE